MTTALPSSTPATSTTDPPTLASSTRSAAESTSVTALGISTFSTTAPTGSRLAPPTGGIDPRGPRFGAAMTSVVLSAALVLASPVLLAVQAVVFALGVLAGPAKQPYGLLFKQFVRPRLAAPTHLEHPGAPRFAQGCGLAFSLVGLLGFALGWQWLALGAIGLALAAAFLNAAFDFCVGCEVYLRAQRLRRT